VIKTVLVSITGRVQGVGYRGWCEGEARMRGLGGWVRNRRDGSVETLLSGDSRKVDEMLIALWKGPDAARVERVSASPATEPMGLGFRILPTA